MPVITKINTNAIADDAVTGDKFSGASYIANSTSHDISGTYSENRLYTSDAYTLSGNTTVNSHLTLSSVKSTDDVVLTAGGAYTPTGTGVLSGGSVVAKANTDLTGMTGVIGDSVTGGSGFVGFHNWISILSKDFVNGGGFATAFSKTIPISKLHPDGTTQLEVEYQLSSDGGGNAPRYFKYSTSGGVTTSETVIGNADSGTIEGSFTINIPNGTSSNININIGSSRGGGGNNTTYSGSNIVVTEVG